MYKCWSSIWDYIINYTYTLKICSSHFLLLLSLSLTLALFLLFVVFLLYVLSNPSHLRHPQSLFSGRKATKLANSNLFILTFVYFFVLFIFFFLIFIRSNKLSTRSSIFPAENLTIQKGNQFLLILSMNYSNGSINTDLRTNNLEFVITFNFYYMLNFFDR